jgi:hypothetical protein
MSTFAFGAKKNRQRMGKIIANTAKKLDGIMLEIDFKRRRPINEIHTNNGRQRRIN